MVLLLMVMGYVSYIELLSLEITKDSTEICCTTSIFLFSVAFKLDAIFLSMNIYIYIYSRFGFSSELSFLLKTSCKSVLNYSKMK